MIRLECLPAGQVSGGPVLWEALAVCGQHRVVQLESEKAQIVVLDETGDLSQGRALLLNMEKQITAGAEAEEILRFQDRGAGARIAALDQFLTKAANVFSAARPRSDARPRRQDGRRAISL